MAIKKIRIRPEGTNSYADVLHPETSASMVVEEANKRFMTDAERAKLNTVSANANAYTHPVGNGNNHIPAGGSVGQFLEYSSAGVAKWSTIQNERALLKNGAYYTTFIEGYKTSNASSGSIRINSNHILFSLYESGVNYEVSVVTDTPIDISSFNTLYIKGNDNNPSTVLPIEIIISPTKIASSSVFTRKATGYTYSNQVVSIPLDGLSGSYYIRIHAKNTFSSGKTAYSYIYEVILAK